MQTRSANRYNAQPKTEQTSEQTLDKIWSEFDRESSTIDSDTRVEGPLADDEEWTVAYVCFQAQLLKRPLVPETRPITTFRWWIRFRTKTTWWCKSNPNGKKLVRERVKELVRAQYSPPLKYQMQCDYCHIVDPQTGHYFLPYYIHDKDFLDIEVMPYNMDTSDDDKHAQIMMPKTIAVVEKLKAQRHCEQLTKAADEQEGQRITRSQAAKLKA